MNRHPLLLTALVLAACSETGLSDKDEPADGSVPIIQLDPPMLMYGELQDGDEEVQTFTVSNVGNAGLDVSDIVIGTGIAFDVLGPDFEFTLAPGEDRTVDVRFRPMGAGENYGSAVVLSNDPKTPEAFVDLLGSGLVPELQITPGSHNFGEAFIPCGTSVELELKNIGDVDLVIEDFDYRSGGLLGLVDPASFRAQLPLTLTPNETSTVWVEFTPTTSGSDTGVFEVTSNDPRGVVTADQNGEGAFVSTNSETFTTPGAPPVDIVITIDQSCSMESDNVDDVQQGFPGFVQELQNVADWQLILVTEDSGCGTGGILTNSTPNAETLLVNNAFPNGSVNYDTTEALLKLTDRALSKTGPGGCNEGLLRPGALLHAVTLSDEREQSGQSGAYWVGQLEGYVTDPNLLKISGVLDINTNCGDGSGPGGYLEAVNQTGGALLNICNANWGAQFTDIASEVLAGLASYQLTDPADAATLEVLVNGVPTTDYEYVEGAQSLSIQSPVIGEGDEVVVNYNILSECN